MMVHGADCGLPSSVKEAAVSEIWFVWASVSADPRATATQPGASYILAGHVAGANGATIRINKKEREGVSRTFSGGGTAA